jgi:hypothetical protein
MQMYTFIWFQMSLWVFKDKKRVINDLDFLSRKKNKLIQSNSNQKLWVFFFSFFLNKLCCYENLQSH